MEQLPLKQQPADSHEVMMEGIQVEDEALAELKKEMVVKQNSFDVAVS